MSHDLDEAERAFFLRRLHSNCPLVSVFHNDSSRCGACTEDHDPGDEDRRQDPIPPQKLREMFFGRSR